MLQILKYKLIVLLNIDNKRSEKIVKNIIASFGIKAGNMIISLMLVPISINYITPFQYGIWLTISSIVSWISFFDIGMGNGLRNKLTQALAFNRNEEAKIYVSTTYGLLTCISIGLAIVIYIVNPFINWSKFLNIPHSSYNLNYIILIVFISFCIQFVVQLLITVLIASHKSSLSNLVVFLGQLAVLSIMYFLKRHTNGTLLLLIITLTCTPILVTILSSLYFYNNSLKEIRPSVKYIDWNYAKEILQTGSAFFFIQIGTLVLFQTSNIVLTNVIGPQAVTKFNISYKLFSIIIMVFSIIITPYWSATTDAYTKRDFDWLKKNVLILRKLWLITTFVVVPIILAFSNYLFDLWIGNTITIPFQLSIAMALYTIGYTCMTLNCYFLNGIGKIKTQVYMYIIVCFVNIPLSIYFAKLLGISGVVLANSLMLLIINIVLWIQINGIINQNSKILNVKMQNF